MIRIVTDEPRFFSDLGDVLRLFYGDVTVSLEAGDVVFEHHFAEAGGLWTDTWASQGKQVALSRPVSDDAPLVVKRLRKRQVKQALYELLKALFHLQRRAGACGAGCRGLDAGGCVP